MTGLLLAVHFYLSGWDNVTITKQDSKIIRQLDYYYSIQSKEITGCQIADIGNTTRYYLMFFACDDINKDYNVIYDKKTMTRYRVYLHEIVWFLFTNGNLIFK